MSSRSTGKGGAQFPEKLSLKDTDGKAVVATIQDAVVRDFAPRGSEREDLRIILSYVEFPDREHVIIPTSYKTLVAKLGDPGEPKAGLYGLALTKGDVWRGKKVALAVVNRTNPETGEDVKKLDVASPSMWDTLMAKYNATNK